MQSSKPSMPRFPEVQDNDSDWSLSSVELEDINMRAEEEAEMDELPSKVSFSAINDDMSQMSKIPAPEKPHLKNSTSVFKIGKLMTFVNEFMVVESTDQMVLDLDNYVFDKDKRILGFVADVFGQTDKPFYAIKLESLDLIPTLEVGQAVYFSEGSRLLGKEVIEGLKKHGTDEPNAKDSDSDAEQVKSDKGPVKRRYEPPTKDEQPKSKRQRPREQAPHNPRQPGPEIYRVHHQQQQQQYRQQQQYMPPQYNQQMPLSYPYPMQHPHQPPVPSPLMNNDQQVYMQTLYKQYYDQMMQFYSK